MNKMYLVLGDWSDDGHGKTDKILVNCNKTHEEIQQGYKDSCKLTGVEFNHNQSYTGIDRDWKEQKLFRICTEYESSICDISETVQEILKEHGLDITELVECGGGTEEFTELWFDFVKLSIPDLVWEVVNDEIPCINGYWNSELNVQFGYGLYWN